jgi:SAM-dependent methyltransferase
LPRGVTRALWEYAHSDGVVGAFDERFSRDAAAELDETILSEAIAPPGVLVDLGCGTGRLTIPLARRGFHCVAVDLSPVALAAVERQAAAAGVSIGRVLANLVDLGCLADGSADYCLMMYSTLGMIRERENRRRALAHVRRILRPGGTFILHVHNRWHNLLVPQGRGWVVANLFAALGGRAEPGDKIFDYHGVPNMFLHVFTRRELASDLAAAGFRIERLIPLAVERRRPLRYPWLLSRLRASGWIAICR